MENLTDKESIVSLNNLMVNVRKKQLTEILKLTLFTSTYRILLYTSKSQICFVFYTHKDNEGD
jgi:hypothetical protein